MQKSKIIKLLSSFDSKELRALNDFVQSPFFNKNQELIQLYSYLKKYAPKSFPEKQVNRNSIFQYLFPGQDYDEKQLNHLLSLLFKLAERFISIRAFEKDGILADCYLLESYIDRHLDKSYNHIYQKALDNLEAEKIKDGHYFFQRFKLAHIAEKKFSRQGVRRYDENLEIASDYFDLYFLSKKLYFLCAIIAREKVVPHNYRKSMVQAIKTYLSENDYSHIPYIAVYHQLLLSLTEENGDIHFKIFRTYLKKYTTSFQLSEQKDLYYYAINFCIQKIHHGSKSYTEVLLNLYQEGIETAVLLEDGFLSPWTFKNMVKLSLGLKRFDWVEDFVVEYSAKLPETEREGALHFNLADLYYHKKEYDRALLHLNQVEFTDIHYNLGAKAMLLKIYYEKEETEAFLSLQSAFRIFLKRNKRISRYTRACYVNFVDFLYQMFKYGHDRHSELRNQIKNSQALNGRNWLLRQLEGDIEGERGE